MLVLKRKLGESILIKTAGIEFEVKVSDISEGKVKLAIDAPMEVQILRKEVVDEARLENTMSAQNKKINRQALKDLKI